MKLIHHKTTNIWPSRRQSTPSHVKGPRVAEGGKVFFTVTTGDDEVTAKSHTCWIPSGARLANLLPILPWVVPSARAQVQNIHGLKEAIPIQRVPWRQAIMFASFELSTQFHQQSSVTLCDSSWINHLMIHDISFVMSPCPITVQMVCGRP